MMEGTYLADIVAVRSNAARRNRSVLAVWILGIKQNRGTQYSV